MTEGISGIESAQFRKAGKALIETDDDVVLHRTCGEPGIINVIVDEVRSVRYLLSVEPSAHWSACAECADDSKGLHPKKATHPHAADANKRFISVINSQKLVFCFDKLTIKIYVIFALRFSLL